MANVRPVTAAEMRRVVRLARRARAAMAKQPNVQSVK